MNEVGGHFHSLAALLEFQVFTFEIGEVGAILSQKQRRVVGDGAGGQAQGLHVVDFHEPVDGGGHVGPVHKRIAAGDDNLLDGRRTAHVIDGFTHVRN